MLLHSCNNVKNNTTAISFSNLTRYSLSIKVRVLLFLDTTIAIQSPNFLQCPTVVLNDVSYPKLLTVIYF